MNETGKSEIFVVDDDQGILDSFDAMLGDDYPLVMLNDSRQALALMCERKPRLLFLDIKMPGMNGIEFLEHVQHCGVSSTQIVIVTAVAQDHYEEMARNYGVYQYLRKPLDVDEIESITKTVLH